MIYQINSHLQWNGELRFFTNLRLLLLRLRRTRLLIVCAMNGIGVYAEEDLTLPSSRGERQRSIEFQLNDNLIHVSACLNSTTVSAVLDSGTGGLILDRGAAKRLNISLASSEQSAVGGGSGPQSLFPVVFADLTFGPIHLNHTGGFALDLGPLARSAGFPVDLLLGEPIFANQVVTIDYPQRHLYFGSGAPQVSGNRIPIEIVNRVPIANVTLRARPDSAPVRLRLIVDLGTRHFAALIGAKFLKSTEGKQLLEGAKQQQIGTGTGGIVMGHEVNISALEVGSRSYHNVKVALTTGVGAFESDYADGSLGVPLWQSAVVRFDYARGELYISEKQ